MTILAIVLNLMLAPLALFQFVFGPLFGRSAIIGFILSAAAHSIGLLLAAVRSRKREYAKRELSGILPPGEELLAHGAARRVF